LDQLDVDILDSFGGNGILFHKIPFNVRKDIVNRYSQYYDEFEEVQIASVSEVIIRIY
jgi:hypothetical protein